MEPQINTRFSQILPLNSLKTQKIQMTEDRAQETEYRKEVSRIILMFNFNRVQMKYFSRKILEQLKKWIDRREIYAIKGPRQSGKTTILKMLQDWLVKEKNVHQEFSLPVQAGAGINSYQ